MTDKLFKVVGASHFQGAAKVRFANDIASRVKIFSKGGHDIDLTELPQPMTKGEAVKFLMTTDIYKDARYAEAIDSADAKYNGSKTVRVSKAKAKAEPSLEAIKARAVAKTEQEAA